MTGLWNRAVDDVLLVEVQCPFCRQFTSVECRADGYRRWLDGEPIDNALWSLPAAERVALATGVCRACWDVSVRLCFPSTPKVPPIALETINAYGFRDEDGHCLIGACRLGLRLYEWPDELTITDSSGNFRMVLVQVGMLPPSGQVRYVTRFPSASKESWQLIVFNDW